jgi:hypothetical protein
VNVICELPTRGSFRTPDSCQIYPRETRRPPVLRDDAREPALDLLRDADGIAAMSRLVGDGPVDCEALGDGSQTCRWIASNQAQGYGLVGTAAQTKKQAEVTCRFSSTTGATVPASCEASQRR